MEFQGELTYLGDLRSPHSGVWDSFRAVNAQIRPSLSVIGIIKRPLKTQGPIAFPISFTE